MLRIDLRAVCRTGLRDLVRRNRGKALVAAAVVAAAFVAYWPTLMMRMFGATLATCSSRGVIGPGRSSTASSSRARCSDAASAPGSSPPGTGSRTGRYPLPHNEYLHLLVNGGIAGFALVAIAIALWYRQLLEVASPNDRAFLFALLPALGIYAITDNVLSYATALALYAYLASC